MVGSGAGRNTLFAFVLGLSFGLGACSRADPVSTEAEKPLPPAVPVFDASLPVEVEACVDQGCRNVLQVTGKKNKRG